MKLRAATADDSGAIAALHAESWRNHYRGAYRDAFLDGDVFEDRRRVWSERLAEPAANQLVLLAESDAQLLGFACAYGAEDPVWGTLLDNLHVRRDGQRRGTGRALVREVARQCVQPYPNAGLYLWVLEQNEQAQRFYRALGARDVGGETFTPPGGGEIRSRRYAWRDLSALL